MGKFGGMVGGVVNEKGGYFEKKAPRPVGKENVKQILTYLYIFRLTNIFNMTFQHSVYIQQSKAKAGGFYFKIKLPRLTAIDIAY